ncbi:MAG: hypothetical protein KIH64_009540 [Mycobacterium sp.]|nr:hypothetical protein [Mycobacterium sp.]
MFDTCRGVFLAVAFAAALTGSVSPAPAAAAQTCAPGFEPNPYTAQCLAPVSTPIINGIPCIPSNIGLCNSFVQNQQPPRGPRPVG